MVASLDPRSATQKPNPVEVAKPNAFSYTVGNVTSFTFALADDFVIGRDKNICMAINPASARTFIPSGDLGCLFLYLIPAAGRYFPQNRRLVFIPQGVPFFTKPQHRKSNGNIKIPNNITSASSAQVDVQQSDYILLAPKILYSSPPRVLSGQGNIWRRLGQIPLLLRTHSYHGEPLTSARLLGPAELAASYPKECDGL